MKVKDIFDVVYGVNLELINCNETSSVSNGVNFVSRTSENNGVVARVSLIDGVTPHEAGTISCAVSGSVLSTFVQSEPYYSGRDLYVLTPKIELKLVEKLFYCYVINANKYRYSYGRAANKTLKDIELPDEIPEWVYRVNLENYYKAIKTNVPYKNLELDTSNWQEFELIDFFEMFAGKYLNKLDYESGSIPYISTSDTNNGVMNFINQEPEFPENCITIGKVGVTTYYQRSKFLATSDVTVLKPKGNFLNKYTGIFITTLIKLESKKWTYGRQIRLGDCKELIIKFPVKDGAPDWGFMENFIKQLPYSDKI